MEKLIHDQIEESNGNSELRNALLESALLGTGIVKGPFNFNKKFKANLLLYNNENPGPLLKANVGDTLKIDFKNNLDQPTSIHWHGIKNINKMDGVPYLTQDPVQPGETFSYEFPVNQSGTYWYHAHFESWKQVAKGLYGPLVVNNETDDFIEDDIVILADDWRLNKKYQIDEKSFGSLMDWSHAGRVGNWLTINGEKSPYYSIKGNSQARLRFINASNARVSKFGSSLKNNNIIGSIKITENISRDSVTYTIESQVETKLILTFKVVGKEKYIYRDGTLIYSSLYRTLNNKVKTNHCILYNDGEYSLQTPEKISPLSFEDIKQNLMILYVHEPIGVKSVFCDNQKQMVKVEPLGKGIYKVELSKGKYNIFHYKNGRCVKIEAVSPLFDVTLIPVLS